MKNQVVKFKVTDLEIHPKILPTIQEKNLSLMNYTMKRFGQQQPISTVIRDGKKYVVDGTSRTIVADSLGLEYLDCLVLDTPEDGILECRIRINQKIRTSMIEKCLEIENFLNILGKSQGKKREMLGFQNQDSDEEYGLVGKDRFQIACVVLGLDIKPSTLRKLMHVFWEEYYSEQNTGTLKLLDEGKISISKAYDLLNVKESKSEKSENLKRLNFESKSLDVSYQLFNTSSMNMTDVKNNSVSLFVDSHPYFQLRKYRNQDILSHGQETTVKEYVSNFVEFCREKRRKLAPGGVMVTVLGETYRSGYQGVCSKVEVALEEDGWELLDVNIWEKSNQKYTPHPLRFVNAYERIIVARKPGGETYFQEVMKKSSTKDYKATKTNNGTFYMASPESCISNVFRTSVHQTSELKVVDNDFTHDGPCPEKIYKFFIEAYSRPGDTICDGFVGSGTIGVGLFMGRNVIGYDVDPVSIKFVKKRFDKILEEKETPSVLRIAA
nr:DNA methyltransferase [uncultured Flavobacterium sp.]